MAPKCAPSSSVGLLAREVIHDYPPILEYAKLESEEIRLVRLESPGVLSIQRAKLSQRPMYYALSYCWGEAEDMQPVQINNHRRLLRGHVLSMLDTLHRKYGKIRVWIDMLCINQNDLGEKDEQVQQMGTIYRFATAVYAWIGEADDSTRLVFDALLKLKDWDRIQGKGDPVTVMNMQQSVTKCSQITAERAGQFRHFYEATTGLATLGPTTDVRVRWEDELDRLRPLFSRPYWCRLWIVQELSLARSVLVHCGEQHIDLTYLDVLNLTPELFRHWVMMRGETESIRGYVSIHTVANLQRYRRVRNVDGCPTIDLWEAVEIFARYHMCKDLRDKVYALRELVEEWRDIKVDYQQSVCSVFRDICKRGLALEDTELSYNLRGPMRKAMGLSHGRVWLGELTDWCEDLTRRLSVDKSRTATS